jgi:8-oxo-dGTP pyrophosphatase MutT (NUDIX family)
MPRNQDTIELMDLNAVARMVEEFQDLSDEAAHKSRILILGLLAHSPTPFSRIQYAPGHITCTGLVIHPSESKILLVHHRRLNRWLLPGGHVEPADANIWDTAAREVVEETGVTLNSSATALIGVDVHGIPPSKREPYHLHHDLIWIFQASSETLQCSVESRQVLWCRFEDFDLYDLPVSIRRCAARAVRVNTP